MSLISYDKKHHVSKINMDGKRRKIVFLKVKLIKEKMKSS
jgi:hypothetical protein